MPKIEKIILLVGLMGSGKTSVGKRLATKLSLPFVDGDTEIEKASGLSLVELFKCFGEEEYRAGEARVMKRLLQGEPCVLASGGGSFVAKQTRELAKKHDAAVWDQFDVMGGLYSMRDWEKAGLAKKDKVHFTNEGYQLLGDLLYNALIKDYRNHLKNK